MGNKSKINEELVRYMEDNAPKGSRLSKLDPVKSYIVKLHADGYSHEQISQFINIIGISAHSTTIGRYIKKHGDKNANEFLPHEEEMTDRITHTKDDIPPSSRLSANLGDLARPQEKTAKFEPFKNNQGNS